MMQVSWPLASSSWDSEEYSAIQEVIDSGFFSMGKLTAEFERQFAKWAGRNYAVMVNSGSSANLIASSALRYVRNADKKPDNEGLYGEVIVPAVSWSTTFFPFHQNRYKLVFVDVDPRTFNLDTSQLRGAITEKTVGICGVNLLGSCANWNEIKDIANENDLWILEDNCEAMGSSNDYGQSGTFGDVSTFSFFYSHHICTMEGGMIVCDDEELAIAMRSLRAHGWARELPIDRDFLGEERESSWNENFRFYLPGYNVRPLEISAAIGIKQLAKFDNILKIRRENAIKLQKVLSGVETNWSLQSSDEGSSWFTFGFVNNDSLNGELYRNRLIEILKQNGIESRPIVAGDFTKNPVFKWLDSRVPSNLPGASKIDNSGLMIGNHHFDLSAQISKLPALLIESENSTKTPGGN